MTQELENWLDVNKPAPVVIDFRHQDPGTDEPFVTAWRRSTVRAMRLLTPDRWGYLSPFGLDDLRILIQDYLALGRGIRVGVDQILVTAGAQHAMDLIAQTLMSPGQMAAVEDPGFPGARLTLAYRGVDVIGVPVDDEGIVVTHIPASCNLVFVTPAHQRPTGAVLSVSRRQQLLEWAHTRGAWIIEDDFDGEYRHHGGPLPSLLLDNPRHVLSILTFSKLLSPALRPAAVIGPPSFVHRLAMVQSLTLRHQPVMEQITLAEFMRPGDFLHHLRRMRRLYRTRHDVLMAQITRSRLVQRFHIHDEDTGLHLFLEADVSFLEEDAVRKAAHQGVGVYPLWPYCDRSPRRGILLGFFQTNCESIVEGVRRLEQLW